MSGNEIYIKVLLDGPYLVYGGLPIKKEIILTDENNIGLKYIETKIYDTKHEPVSICRCGKSKDSPYCDGSHNCIVNLEETADFEQIETNAKVYKGPRLTLKDNEKYCALARFCDAKETIWNLINNDNDESEIEVKKQAMLCPSGRLMIFDKNGNPLEENSDKSISVLEDQGFKISGPIFLKGGIRVESASGKSYEIRNRQTLCRCGHSKNKPFCDCSHKHINFKAQYKE